MHAILGKKQGQTQRFLQDGTRVPVTVVEVKDNPVIAIKTMQANGYVAVQVGQGKKKHPTKPTLGHTKKGASLDYAPNFLHEVRFPSDTTVDKLPNVGDMIAVASVLEAGDLVDVTGKSKGKGFAGGVKRYHFKGGPRTHGQSDRERAPGSIGQTTTPGRVYKGKRMAGKMGNETVTLKNLEVIDVTIDGVLIKGLVPGIPGSYIVIKKVGKNKKHVGLLKDEVVKAEIPTPEPQVTTPQEPQTPKVEEPKQEAPKEIKPAEEKLEESTVIEAEKVERKEEGSNNPISK